MTTSPDSVLPNTSDTTIFSSISRHAMTLPLTAFTISLRFAPTKHRAIKFPRTFDRHDAQIASMCEF